MREILFRGKTDNGEWVQGLPFKWKNKHTGTEHCKMITSVGALENVNYAEGCAVDPETVGQYIGLTDKHGTRIFEGDLVRNSEQGEVYEIAYIEQYARFAGHKPGIVFAMFDFEQCEVIGNFHDKPELLGKYKTREAACALTDEDDCVEKPLFWQPRIVRGQPSYVCPYCGASAGTTIPGPYCAKCGEPVDMQGTYAEHFVKDGAEWVVRAKSTVEKTNGN